MSAHDLLLGIKDVLHSEEIWVHVLRHVGRYLCFKLIQ